MAPLSSRRPRQHKVVVLAASLTPPPPPPPTLRFGRQADVGSLKTAFRGGSRSTGRGLHGLRRSMRNYLVYGPSNTRKKPKDSASCPWPSLAQGTAHHFSALGRFFGRQFAEGVRASIVAAWAARTVARFALKRLEAHDELLAFLRGRASRRLLGDISYVGRCSYELLSVGPGVASLRLEVAVLFADGAPRSRAWDGSAPPGR